MAADQPLKTYRGNCHCAAFVFEFKAPEITEAYECNCSICRKKGYLLVIPAEDSFGVVEGSEDQLTTYSYGEGKYEHKFCPDCGTGVLCRSKTSMVINAHSIQDLVTWDLKITPLDGAKQGAPYQAPAHKGELPTAQVEGGVTYTGSCHCGKLTVAVNTKPIDETYDLSVVVCNCSVCERFGAVWVYPPPAQVVLAGNPEDIGKRVFASNTLSKTFCRTCGVPMTNQNLVFTSEMGLQTRAEGRGGVTRYETHPVNIRVLDNERLDLSKLDIIKAEGSKFLPAYVNP